MPERDAVTDLQGRLGNELCSSLQGVDAGVDRRGDAVQVVVEDADADRKQQRVDGLLVRARGCRRPAPGLSPTGRVG